MWGRVPGRVLTARALPSAEQACAEVHGQVHSYARACRGHFLRQRQSHL